MKRTKQVKMSTLARLLVLSDQRYVADEDVNWQLSKKLQSDQRA